MSFPLIKSIGKPSAEEDAVLDYFLTTDSVQLLKDNEVFLIVGRKGAGKTALVRHFTKDQTNPYYRALNLRGYPWALHAELSNAQGSEIESYVSSWRYLIAAQAASAVLEQKWDNEIDQEKRLRNFFTKNYGAPVVDVDKVFSPNKIIIEKAVLDPKFRRASIGSIEFRTVKPDFGQQIEAVASEIMKIVSEIMVYRGSNHIELHFDELDFGLEKFEREREILIVGLVLAVQSFRGVAENKKQLIRPFVYLRHDLWDSLSFSDRNKISRGPTLILNWNSTSLKQMVDVRLAKISDQNIGWNNLIDERLMRGNQAKWDHIVSRTLDRPRDVISFLNIVLGQKSSNQLITNEDVSGARADYSTYFKEELDDEIKAHWPEWNDALGAFRDIGYVTFSKAQFEETYDRIKSKKAKTPDANEALKKLFEYSVVAYLRPKSGGGSDWVWRYRNRTSTYDARAERFRVHPGLIEFANLREERRDRRPKD